MAVLFFCFGVYKRLCKGIILREGGGNMFLAYFAIAIVILLFIFLIYCSANTLNRLGFRRKSSNVLDDLTQGKIRKFLLANNSIPYNCEESIKKYCDSIKSDPFVKESLKR